MFVLNLAVCNALCNVGHTAVIQVPRFINIYWFSLFISSHFLLAQLINLFVAADFLTSTVHVRYYSGSEIAPSW